MLLLPQAMHKPNDQTVILWRGVAGLFAELPISKLKGLGGKLGEQLRTSFGATTCGEVLAVGEARLGVALSCGTGRWVLRLCSGHDDEPVADKSETKSMLAAKSFDSVRTMDKVEDWLAVLSAELRSRLCGDARTPRGLTLSWRRSGGSLAGASTLDIQP
jgi:DNA polymerase eta